MINIRQATTEDLPGILEIYNEVVANTTAVFMYEPHTLAMRQEWFATKQQQGYPVYVAMEGEEITGFSTIGPFRAWPGYKYSVENSVYVKDSRRGKGIGKSLVLPLITAAQQLDMHTIVAGIEAENTGSIRMHESLGFKEVAHFREVGFKFGRWLDLKFLQLILPTPNNPVDG